jgi:hypothetical protein
MCPCGKGYLFDFVRDCSSFQLRESVCRSARMPRSVPTERAKNPTAITKRNTKDQAGSPRMALLSPSSMNALYGPTGEERLFIVFTRQPQPDLDKLIYAVGRSKAGDASADRTLLAQVSLPNDMISRLREQVASRDLVLESVDSASADTGGRVEKAKYVVNPSTAPDARLIVDVSLKHIGQSAEEPIGNLDRAGIGTLIISTGEDGVRVFINNREYARRTQRGQLRIQTIGAVTVRVLKTGFEAPPAQTVEVTGGEEVRVEFKMNLLPQFASLEITGEPPGADVRIDGSRVGAIGDDGRFRAPVAPGEHVVELIRPKFPPEMHDRQFLAGQTVQITKGVAVAVVANPGVPVSNLSFAELREILLGDRPDWNPGLRVTLIIQAPAASERAVLLKTVYQMSEVQFRQYWISKVFRAEAAAGPRIANSNEQAAEMLATIPGAIGFIDAAEIPKGLKVLRLDELLPLEPGYRLH